MIALMIKAGWQLFSNELGVRLLSVLSNILTLIITWNLLSPDFRKEPKNAMLFVLVISVLPAFNVFGFIATPDSPLLLFTAVFLLAYRKFIDNENLPNALFTGFSMATLMYSKYHGALLILMVVLSNLRLFRSRWFWFSGAFALTLLLPHMFWQISNGIPSLKYHLVERASGFDTANVPAYFMNILLMHNPLILPVCLWIIFKSPKAEKFENACKYTVGGFLVFFFIASFRWHIQAQWTSLLSIPLVILLFNNIEIAGPGAAGYLKKVSLIILPFFIFARMAFMADFLPVRYLKNEFHQNRSRAVEIGKLAGDRPVVFTNSYQNASVYTFYTGKFAHSLNNLNYRKNQYDLWDFEERLHGKEVLYLPHFMTDQLRPILKATVLPYGDTLFWTVFRDFQSLQRECAIPDSDNYSFSKGKVNTLNIRFYNPYPFTLDINHKELPVVFQMAFIRNGEPEFRNKIELPAGFTFPSPGDTIAVDCRLTIEDMPEGDYTIAVCSETGVLYVTYNSRFRKAVVTK